MYVVSCFFAAFVAGLLGAAVLGTVLALRRKPIPFWTRSLLVVFLLAPIPFSLFGFLESFEGRSAGYWAFRLGYAVLFLGCLVSVVRLGLPRRP